MKTVIKNLFYYVLLLLGLCIVSWILWSRFLRERTIRDIPDHLFTEFRFWILLYICSIYIYSIKSLIKPKKSNEVLLELIKILYTPLVTLDDALKYNTYLKPRVIHIVNTVVELLNKMSKNQLITVIFVSQILPRSILVIFLLLDSFWFHKLEIMYKVILLGLLPLGFRYFSYSLKSVSEHWIKELELYYSFVYLFQEDFEYEFKSEEDFIPEHHYKKKSIREYINIKYDNWINYCSDNVNYQYVGSPYPEDHIIEQYSIRKYNNDNVKLNSNDYAELRELFIKLVPKILRLKYFSEILSIYKNHKVIKWPKILIFSLYLLSWGYILIISQYYYTVDLVMGEYFLYNLMSYLIDIDNDPFSRLYDYSQRENLVTLKNIKLLLSRCIEIILKKLC